jgi:hypothetical protein
MRQQRVKASRWLMIIQLYFRDQMTRTQIAQELALNQEASCDQRAITVSAVNSMIRSIGRAGEGFRSNNGGRRHGKRGNPNWKRKQNQQFVGSFVDSAQLVPASGGFGEPQALSVLQAPS